MSLLLDFNNECSKLKTMYNRLQEPKLVEALVNTLNNNYSHYITSKMLHQNYIKYIYNTQPVKREICDMLVVIKRNNIYRFSFIQNKNKVYDKYKGLDCFYVNKGQHIFLTNLPNFTPVSKNSNTFINGIPSNIFQNHQYDTITTYSVFYTNQQNQIDFDLSSAISVKTKNPIKYIKGSASAYHQYTQLTHGNNEYISHKNCNEITRFPDFGEVISPNTQTYNELLSIIKTFKIDPQTIIDFFKDDNINKKIIDPSPIKNNGVNLIVKNLTLIDLDKK